MNCKACLYPVNERAHDPVTEKVAVAAKNKAREKEKRSPKTLEMLAVVHHQTASEVSQPPIPGELGEIGIELNKT